MILRRLKRVGWDKQTGCWWAVGRGFAPVCDGPPILRDLVSPYRAAKRVVACGDQYAAAGQDQDGAVAVLNVAEIGRGSRLDRRSTYLSSWSMLVISPALVVLLSKPTVMLWPLRSRAPAFTVRLPPPNVAPLPSCSVPPSKSVPP